MAGFGQRLLSKISTRDVGEKAAMMAATISVGESFSPSLLPRKPAQQAVVTGLSATLVYGVSRVSNSFIESMTRVLVPGRGRAAQENRRVLTSVAQGAAIATGLALFKILPPHRGEPVKRAVVRAAGLQLANTGALGLVTTGANVGVDALLTRSGRIPPGLAPTGFVIGASVAGGEIWWHRRAQSDGPPLVSSLAQGVLVMTGVSMLSALQRKAASFIARGIRTRAPGFAGLAEPIGQLAALTPLGITIWLGLEAVVRRTEIGGAAIEQAYHEPTTADNVSGSPDSLVDWESIGREGRRFVNMVLDAQEITQVTGSTAMNPIRVFVGVHSAATVDARVSLAMDELERMGAFDRDVLCLASPTGTGYINYVVAETLEFLTGGNCATVALQYSLRPSFLSLDRIHLGREQNRVLLHAINGRLRAMPAEKRPKFVIVGESLGAFTLQDSFLHEGTAGLHRLEVHRALFIGTPAESKWAEQWRLDPEHTDPGGEVIEVDSYEQWLELPAAMRNRVRYFLLSHHDDPITKFRPALAVQEPEWMKMGENRCPALVPTARWHQFTTFFLTAVDVMNANIVIPGQFEARGHDYRADLARFTSVAFDLPVTDAQLATIETALRERELKWAAARVIEEEKARAQEAIRRQLKSWNVSYGS